MISTLTQMADGTAVEVGIAGHEGMSALSLSFGNRTSPHTTIVQISQPDNASYSMPADAFLAAQSDDRELHERCKAFGEYSFIAATQFAACNRLHPVEERYARWLLMADDRVGGGEFMLTQDFTAEMLGVRRASVTVVAGMLSTAGLIAYRRGHLQVRDLEGLRNTACECYQALDDELQRLLGYQSRIVLAPS
jgi:CRP-like cAMP-binding protein